MRKFIQYKADGTFSVCCGDEEPKELPDGVEQIEIAPDVETIGKMINPETKELYDTPPPPPTFQDKWGPKEILDALENEGLMKEMKEDIKKAGF